MYSDPKQPALRIRAIRPGDNPAVTQVIRRVMAEFGAVGCGYSSADAELDDMYEAYRAPDSVFLVVTSGSEAGERVVGCGGIGPLAGGDAGVCELRKMYFDPEVRGLGLGNRLLSALLDAARAAGYSLCYLETLDSMQQARRLYRKFGFTPAAQAMGDTGHPSCNRYMTLDLRIRKSP